MSIQGKLTLRNYRCFDWNNPAILEFGNGFTAYVGANNAGKSAALRSIYELRYLLGNLLAAPTSRFQPLGTTDIAELFNENDPGRFHCDIELINCKHPKTHQSLIATAVTLECSVQTTKLIKLKALVLLCHKI